jgi:YD repeat-containing protein
MIKNIYLPLCLLVLTLHFVNTLPAQTGGHNPFQVFAPNTFELAKYGDIPVDFSSGVPNINIPLTKMTDKDISLDVSLSYHGSGIKVDQEATWVGLGWSLNCGGIITREVRGQADYCNMTANGMNFRTSIQDYNYSGTQTVAQYCQQQGNALQAGAYGGSDNGADIFYFNFNGRSGKFFLDNDAKAVFVTYEDLKITLLPISTNWWGTSFNFIITDERGFKYEFSDQEMTSSATSAGVYISAWYLSKITSPAGGSIVIEYTGGGLTTTQYQKRCFNDGWFAVNPGHGSHILPQAYLTACVTYDTNVGGIVPSKITTGTGNTLTFVVNTGQDLRLDSEPLINNKLNALVMKDNTNTEVRRFRFGYNYFVANNSRKFPSPAPGNPREFLNYRLRLDSLWEVSPTGVLNAPYAFTYYGDNDPETDDVYTLPYRLSPSQDHWGYYNGTNNLTMFPYNPPDKRFTIDEMYRRFLPSNDIGGWQPGFTFKIENGGNREADGEAIKAACLKKIVYPTGGYSEFDFEGHNASVDNYWPIIGGVRIKQITSNPGTGPSVVKQYTYESYMSSDKCLDINNPYYFWYWNWNLGDETMAQGQMAFGVPAELAYNSTYIVRGDIGSQLLLGAGNNGIYTQVKEAIPGNGYTQYEYTFGIDGETGLGSGNASEDSLFPGLFNGAFVDVYDQGGWGSGRYVSISMSSCVYPYPNFFNNDWRRGHLRSKKVFAEGGTTPLQMEETQYQIQAIKGVPGYKVIGWPNGGRVIYARYYNAGGLVKPVKQIKTVTANGIDMVTTTDIDYTSTFHKQVTETRQTVSNGQVVTTQYYYPTEYTNAFTTLKNKNILQPVDIRTYKNGTLVSGTQVTYSDAGLPTAFYQAEGNTAFSALNPFTFSPRGDVVYNADNTLRIQSDITGSREIFLWSYKGQYPVAKIENSTYADLLVALSDPSESFINELRSKTAPSGPDLTALNALRQHAKMKQAQITTYTYKPLIGMTAQTDMNGKTTYYEYDSFGRLTIIRDENNHILKRMDYRYATQP